MKKVKMVEMIDFLLTEKEYKKFLVNLEDDVQKYADSIADKKTQSFGHGWLWVTAVKRVLIYK